MISSQKSALLASALLLAVISWLPTARADRAGRELPPHYKKSPFSLMSLSVGHPNAGWQVRAKRLRNTRYLKVRPSSQDRSYAHPALVLMLQRSAQDIGKMAPGAIMFVGDLSTENGGPISGHRSHQSGRDADLAFYMRDKNGKRVPAPHFVAFDGEGKARDGSGYVFDDELNWLLVQSWARDTRAGLSHIFISHPLRQRLIRFAQSHEQHKKYLPLALALLKQPERGEPHDDHFHVRITCPEKQADICRPNPR
jgi:penicillin-insensitive murein endopeptidase